MNYNRSVSGILASMVLHPTLYPLGLMLRKSIFVTEQSHQEPSLLFFAFFTLMVFATIIVWGTIYIATIVLIIRRFAKTVFGREGYLTNTLPVSAHQLILSNS